CPGCRPGRDGKILRYRGLVENRLCRRYARRRGGLSGAQDRGSAACQPLRYHAHQVQGEKPAREGLSPLVRIKNRRSAPAVFYDNLLVASHRYLPFPAFAGTSSARQALVSDHFLELLEWRDAHRLAGRLGLDGHGLAGKGIDTLARLG